MMPQRYAAPLALAWMAKGLCPECGNPPEAHDSHPITLFYAGVCGFGGLLRRGVEERLAQYRADRGDSGDGE